MAHLVLGLDVGTTGTKAVLADPETGIGPVAQASKPATLSSPHPGWAEADPAQWWANVCALVPQVLSEARATASDIAAVAATGMVPAVIPLGAGNAPLRPAILQNDARASQEISDLAAALPGLDFTAVTGSPLTQQSVAPTLLWLARHEPDVHAATATVLGSYDWLAVALGARPHAERNWALESGLYALDAQALLAEVCEAAGFNGSVLPTVENPGTAVGEVSGKAAAQTGLRAGTPVVTGGADHVLSAYAAGLASPGDWLVKLGGAGDILVVTDQVLVDPRLYLDAHPRPGLWLPNGCMATSGSLIRWFQSLTGDTPVAELEREAEAAQPAGLVCLPYFLGEKSPLHDPDLRGAFLGLHLGHTRGDMYRAILEAIAYGFRQHAEIFAERGVLLRDAARVSNGGSRSRVWKQVLADALGVALEPVTGHPGAAYGAALAAAVGAGLLPGWTVPAAPGAAAAPAEDRVEPDPALTGRYETAYQIYLDAASALAPISHRLARRSTP
jgi:xylulokinase